MDAIVGLDAVGAESWLTLLAGAGTAAALRLLALAFDWRIPPWPPDLET
jgi:hypothetical protein